MLRSTAAGLLLVALAAAALLAWGTLEWRREAGLRTVEAWMPEILDVAEEQGIDPFLLAGVVYAESRGDADAVSSVGALGLCQLMPATAEELAMRLDVEGPPYSARDNLRMGARYLRELLQRWDGDTDLALLGYRMGPTRVAREVAEQGREAWIAALQESTPSPWSYRVQVLLYGERLRSRAAER